MNERKDLTTNRVPEEKSFWGKEEAEKYAVAKHGPDGRKFLDPYLYGALEGEAIQGKDVIDIGAGAGAWTKHINEKGSRSVVSADINWAMVSKAKADIGGSGELPQGIMPVQADATKLPFNDNQFDTAVSINVGCNLPEEAFKNQFNEALRVVKKDGKFIVTAPISLLEVFSKEETEGLSPDLIQEKIDNLWANQYEGGVKSTAKEIIGSFEEILRGTFILDKEGKPILITKENRNLVKPGDPILRKLPGLVVENNYHTAEEYEEAAQAAGWKIESLKKESFSSEEERMDYNKSVPKGEQLGEAYVGNPPFLVMVLEKS